MILAPAFRWVDAATVRPQIQIQSQLDKAAQKRAISGSLAASSRARLGLGVVTYAETSKTNSISTGASSGSTATPTAERTWIPKSPNTLPRNIEAPFATPG